MKQAMTRHVLGIAEMITPVLKESKFRETGVITPVEFVAAGDYLVHHCPTWQWASGDKSKLRSYLPPEKQYLFTRSVPCYKRVKQMENYKEEYEKILEPDDPDGGWVDTHNLSGVYVDQAAEHDSTNEIKDFEGDKAGGVVDVQNSDDDEDVEGEDMEAYAQSGMLDEVDPAVVTSRMKESDRQLGAIASSSAQMADATGDAGAGILQTRTYDLYITYDKYYQTPRLWLYGYDEQHEALTETQMYEDFSQDHAKKTVTTEAHPHLSGQPMPSIHPCRQADVMRKLIETVAEGGAELAVHQYLVVFLKFVQAVIPTIEYDYTRNFNLGWPS